MRDLSHELLAGARQIAQFLNRRRRHELERTSPWATRSAIQVASAKEEAGRRSRQGAAVFAQSWEVRLPLQTPQRVVGRSPKQKSTIPPRGGDRSNRLCRNENQRCRRLHIQSLEKAFEAASVSR